MADVIAEFESKKGRPPIYPWDQWADGKARRLYRGQDFFATPVSFRTMVHRRAHDMGLHAYVDINKADDSVKIRFYKED
jgi:hypothetical protein